MHRRSRSFPCRKAAGIVLYLITYAVPLYGEEHVLDRSSAVSLGLHRSFELETAELLLTAQRRKHLLGIRNYLPRLELGLSFDDSVTVAGSDSRTKRMTASLDQPVYSGGAVQFARKTEEIEISIA